MDLDENFAQKILSLKKMIKRLELKLSEEKDKSFNAYCPSAEKIITNYPQEYFDLKSELDILRKITNDRLILEDVIPIIKQKYLDDVDIKVSYMSIKATGQSNGRMSIYYKGTLVANFLLTKYHMFFSLSNDLLKIDHSEFSQFKSNVLPSKIIEGLSYTNNPFIINIDGNDLLMSVAAIEYRTLNVQNFCSIIFHFIDDVYATFSETFFYKNKKTNRVEFLVSKRKNGGFYLRDMREFIDYFSNSKRVSNGFSRFKEAFENKIPRLKNKFSRHFEKIG